MVNIKNINRIKLKTMNKKFELLREAVNTYKVNHCDGNKNEKELLKFIDELEQLTIPVVVKSFTAEEVVNELKENETLDDAITFFNSQK